MANEIQVRVNMLVKNGNLQWQNASTQNQFNVTQVGDAKGPTPGMIACSVDGTDITFPQLTTPGMCWICNLDTVNFVTYGIWDPETTKFYPVGEIGPGEFYPIKFSRSLQEEYGSVGTGTTGPDTNRFHIKADTAECNVRIDAFER